MRASIPDLHPELFHKGASVVREPEWRRIHTRLLQEIERLGLTLDEVALGVSQTADMLRNPIKPLGFGTLYWLALAGADISFVLAGERARHRTHTRKAV